MAPASLNAGYHNAHGTARQSPRLGLCASDPGSTELDFAIDKVTNNCFSFVNLTLKLRTKINDQVVMKSADKEKWEPNHRAYEEVIDSASSDVNPFLLDTQWDCNFELASRIHAALFDYLKCNDPRRRAKGSVQPWHVEDRWKQFFDGWRKIFNQALSQAVQRAASSLETIFGISAIYQSAPAESSRADVWTYLIEDSPHFLEERDALAFLLLLFGVSSQGYDRRYSPQEQRLILRYIDLAVMRADVSAQKDAAEDPREPSEFSELPEQQEEGSFETEKISAMGEEFSNLSNKMQTIAGKPSVASVDIEKIPGFRDIEWHNVWRAGLLPFQLAESFSPLDISHVASSLRRMVTTMQQQDAISSTGLRPQQLAALRKAWTQHEESRQALNVLSHWVSDLLVLFQDPYCEFCWRHRHALKRCRSHSHAGAVTPRIRFGRIAAPVFRQLLQARQDIPDVRWLAYGSSLDVSISTDHIKMVQSTGVEDYHLARSVAILHAQLRLIFPALAGDFGWQAPSGFVGGPLADSASGLFSTIVIIAHRVRSEQLKVDRKSPSPLAWLCQPAKELNLRLFFKLWFGQSKWPSDSAMTDLLKAWKLNQIPDGYQVRGLGHDVKNPVTKAKKYDIRRCVLDLARERAWLRAVHLVLMACTPASAHLISKKSAGLIPDSPIASRSTRYERRQRTNLVNGRTDLPNQRIRCDLNYLASLVDAELQQHRASLIALTTHNMYATFRLDVDATNFRISDPVESLPTYPVDGLEIHEDRSTK